MVDACAGHIRLNVELKDYSGGATLVPAVLEILHSHDFTGRTIISCLQLAPLEQSHRLDAELPVGMILSTSQGDITRLPVEFLSLHQRLVNTSLVRRAHRRGMEVHAWGVSDQETACTARSWLRQLDHGRAGANACGGRRIQRAQRRGTHAIAHATLAARMSWPSPIARRSSSRFTGRAELTRNPSSARGHRYGTMAAAMIPAGQFADRAGRARQSTNPEHFEVKLCGNGRWRSWQDVSCAAGWWHSSFHAVGAADVKLTAEDPTNGADKEKELDVRVAQAYLNLMEATLRKYEETNRRAEHDPPTIIQGIQEGVRKAGEPLQLAQGDDITDAQIYISAQRPNCTRRRDALAKAKAANRRLAGTISQGEVDRLMRARPGQSENR